MKFYIAVEETRRTVIEVKAENPKEAIWKVEEAYSEGEICLNSIDYIDGVTYFYDETDRQEKCVNGTDFQKIS